MTRGVADLYQCLEAVLGNRRPFTAIPAADTSTTSGELFQTDPEFRKALNAKLPEKHRLADPAKPPNRGEYRIVFAIVSDRAGSLALPFFSGLNLKHAARGLQGYGFHVAKTKIAVSEQKAKLNKFKARKRAA